MIATGRMATPRGMNKLEEAFGGYLLAQKHEGIVAWFAYEACTLKLADDCRYTPDWMAMQSDGELVVYEVKGPHKRDDSIVKLKVAARLFPLRFFLVTRPADRWDIREIRA